MNEELEEPIMDFDGENKKKGGGARETQLVQDIDGFQIFRTPTSFALRLPDGRFGGYFTSLGSIFRAIVKVSLTDKLLKRPVVERRKIESFCGLVEGHEAYVNELASKFDNFIVGVTMK